MQKAIIFIITAALITMLAACDTRTSTDDYLQGDFVIANEDTTQPNLLSPNNGAKITDTEVVLEWSAKQGAAYYIVEVATDPNFQNMVQKDGTPLQPVIEPETTLSLAVGTDLEAKTYYWRVYADTTEYKEDKSDLAVRVFDVIDSNTIYVYCPTDAATCDDTQCSIDGGTTTTKCVGNISKPFRTIQKAVLEAQRNDIAAIKIATRGQNKAYTGIFNLEQGINLLGGYTSDFTDANRNVATGKTIVQGNDTYTILASKIYFATTFDGFIVKGAALPTLSIAFYIEASNSSFQIKNTEVISGQVTGGGSYGLFIENKSFVTLDGLTVSGSSSASKESYAVSIGSNSNVTITNSAITAGQADTTANNGHSVAVSISEGGSAVLRGNTISGGSSDYESVGVYIEQGYAVDLDANTITGGSANMRSYGIYVKESTGQIRNNTITGGAVSAAGSVSYGLKSYDNNSNLTISSNAIQSGSADSESIGVEAGKNIDSYKTGVGIIQNNIKNGSAVSTYGIKIAVSPAFNDTKVFNNIVVNSYGTTTGYGVYSNTEKLIFNNNTVVVNGAGTANYGFYADFAADIIINNNIISIVNSSNNTGIFFLAAATANTLTANACWIFATNQTEIDGSMGDIKPDTLNPNNDPNLDPTTYYPTSSSDKNIRYGGVDLSSDFTVDITGASRSAVLPGAPDTPDYGAGWSMGANEY